MYPRVWNLFENCAVRVGSLAMLFWGLEADTEGDFRDSLAGLLGGDVSISWALEVAIIHLLHNDA